MTSTPGRIPWPSRNGLPPSNYAYRGSGRDVLTPPQVMAEWNRKLRDAGGNPYPTRREDEERTAVIARQLAQGVTPVPVRRRPAPAPPRPLADLEAELTARGVIEPEPVKPVDYWPAYCPGPGVPGRCEDCGYMLTAPGHKVTCGGAP